LKERLTDEYRPCFNFSEDNRMLIYVLKDKHLEQLNKAAATTLHATIRRSVAQKAHLEKLRKTEALQAIIRRRNSV
jgi:L-aminopeptidase/D-esterase-like protein